MGGGGGIKLGEVVGATNAQAEVVVDSPVRPQDLAATIYHAARHSAQRHLVSLLKTAGRSS